MVSTAPALSIGPSPLLGLGRVFYRLFQHKEFVQALERARAKALLLRLARQLIRNELSLQEFETARDTLPGKTLAQHQSGRAALALLHASALASAENCAPISNVLVPAKHYALTRTVAFLMEGMALEALGRPLPGNAPSGALSDKELTNDFWAKWYQILLQVNVVAGIRASVRSSSARFGQAVDRFLVLQAEAAQRGFTEVAARVLLLWESFLRRDFTRVLQYQHQDGTLTEQITAEAHEGMQRAFDSTQRETDGRALDAFNQFSIAVRLLTIDDPWKGWDALAQEVSQAWPGDRSAVDVIREMRD